VEDAESEIAADADRVGDPALKDRGYLNDFSVCRLLSSLRRDNQKFGRRRVVTDLKIKGVHGDVIERL